MTPEDVSQRSPFQYGPRTKGKPNSQGTLFRVDKSQRTPESRQPRGYSPERYAEVAKATGMVSTVPKKEYGAEHYHQGIIGAPQHKEYYAQTQATLARSTAPARDMENSRWYTGDPGKGNLGVYRVPSENQAGRAMVTIKQTADATQGRTPVHELGHHVDYNRGLGAFSSGEPGPRGEQEGFADSYAAEHARQPGYKRKPAPQDYQDRPSRPQDWGPGYHLGDNDQNDFTAHYNRARYRDSVHPSLSADEFSFANRRKTGVLPKEYIEGQEPMLDKFAHTETDKATGEHKMAHHWSYSFDPPESGPLPSDHNMVM